MPTYRVKFHFKRTLTCFVEAESESDIDDFMTENPAFNPLEDAPELVEEDETGYDEDEDALGDYEVVEDDNVSAMFAITPGLELQELE